MKSKVSTRLIIATAAVYVAGLIIGLFIIWMIPYARYTSYMKTLANDLAEDYLTKWSPQQSIFGMDYFLYTEDKNPVITRTQFITRDQMDLFEPLLAKVSTDKSYLTPVYFKISSSEDNPYNGSFWGLFVAEIYHTEHGQPFISVLFKVFTELGTSLLIYLIIYSLMFIIGAFYMFYYIRKTNELNQVQRDLVANVSHELKTPITTIHAMAEVIHDGIDKSPDSQIRYSGMILSEADRLAALVSNILKLSKLQSKKMDYHKTLCHADGILTPTFDRYMMLCADTGQTLDISQLDLQKIPSLYTDLEKINTVLDVLLSNAVKYSGPTGTIKVTQEVHSRHVVFCISDDGPGIEPEKIKHIFDRFYRADESRNTPGSGLGLAIAREIINGLDEKIWVKSQLGEGSQFYFTISFKN